MARRAKKIRDKGKIKLSSYFKNIEDGERVWVQSKVDRLEAIATASEKTRSDTAEMAPCHWKDDQGGINRLREAIPSDMGPTVAFNETRVSIHKL